MTRATIYTRTDKGERVAASASRELANDLRKVLNVIDGTSSVAELQSKANFRSVEWLERALAALVADDLICEAEASTGALDFTSFQPSVPTADQEQKAKLAAEEAQRKAAELARQAAEEQKRKAAEEQKAKLAAEEAQRKTAELARQATEEQKRKLAEEQKAKLAAEEAQRKGAELVRQGAEAQKLRLAEAQKAKLAEEQKRKLAEEEAQRKAADQARQDAEQQARKQAEEQELKLAAERVHRRAAERAGQESEEQARKKAEEELRLASERVRQRAAEHARREAEEQARKQAEEQQRKQAEEQARKQAEEQERIKAVERARQDAEEQARKLAEEQERRKAAERAREEAEQQARKLAEDLARRDADEKARHEAEEKARREAEERIRQEVEEKARREAEEKVRQEAEEKSRREAEERARQEAEAKARQEAEAKARREAEERVKREAEQKAKREAEDKAKREAEEKAKREAEERAKREAGEKAKREAEEKARREAEDKARREAEEKARHEAEEVVRREEEEVTTRREGDDRARKEAEAKERMAAEEIAWREAEEKFRREEEAAQSKRHKKAAAKEGRTGSARLPPWSKAVALVFAVLLVLAPVVLHLISFDGQIPQFEKALAGKFQQPVKIQALYLSLVPEPHLRLEGISIGSEGQIRILKLKATGSLGNLFNEKKLFKAVELDSPVLTEEGLGWILFGKPSAGGMVFGPVSVLNGNLDSKNVSLPVFEAKLQSDSDGTWKTIVIESADKNFSLDLAPKGESVQIEFKARSYRIPFGSNLTLEDLAASGTADRTGLAVTEFKGFAYGGILSGSARLKWGAQWSLSGKLNAKQVDTSRLFPSVVDGGRLVGAATYAMQAPAAAGLFATNRLEGEFLVARGSLLGVDLGRMLQGGGISGTTRFGEITGGFVHDHGAAQLRQVRLTEATMSANGAVDVDVNSNVRGRFAVDLKMPGSARQANVALAGTLQKIEWRRQ